MNNEMVEDRKNKDSQADSSAGNQQASTALFRGTFDYTVEKGDTLWSIAKDTVPQDRGSDKHLQQCIINIINENRLADKNQIEVGQKLTVPIPCDAKVDADESERQTGKAVSIPVRSLD